MCTGRGVERSESGHLTVGDATRIGTFVGRGVVRTTGIVVAFGLAVLVAGCGDTDFSSSAPDAGHVDVGDLPRPPAGDLPRPPVGTVSVPDPTDSTPDSTPDSPPDSSAGVAPADPADTGPTVPGSVGLGADDVCLAWSQIWRTHQVLSMASDFGRLTDVQLARLEVVAAALVTDAVGRLDAALEAQGAAVGAERPVVRQEVLGRFEARARAALVVLDELASSDDVQLLLTQVWLDALRNLDPDATVPELADLGPEFGPIVDRASATFAADAPRWDDDPALDVEAVAVPATDELVRRACADLGVPPIGDAF